MPDKSSQLAETICREPGAYPLPGPRFVMPEGSGRSYALLQSGFLVFTSVLCFLADSRFFESINVAVGRNDFRADSLNNNSVAEGVIAVGRRRWMKTSIKWGIAAQPTTGSSRHAKTEGIQERNLQGRTRQPISGKVSG